MICESDPPPPPPLYHPHRNVLCLMKLILTKTVQTKKTRSPKCANCRGPHVANYRDCPAYKDQAFRQHLVQNQVSYACILKQASPPPPSNTFNFTADQTVSLVTIVIIQIALPQLCRKKPAWKASADQIRSVKTDHRNRKN